MDNLPIIADKKEIIRVANQKPPKYIRPEQIHLIIENAKKDRYKLLFLLLWETGVRISEALSLKPEDIDWHTKQMRIKTLKRKGNMDRYIPLKEELLGALATYIQTYKISNSDRLFGMTPQAVHSELKSIVDRIGFPHWIHIHTLRHSFAINCLYQGMAINNLKEVLGHANVENTMIYLKVFQPDIQEQFNKIKF